MVEWLKLAAIILILFVVCSISYFTGYEVGQIDAANGVMKYELKPVPDGSTRWKHK